MVDTELSKTFYEAFLPLFSLRPDGVAPLLCKRAVGGGPISVVRPDDRITGRLFLLGRVTMYLTDRTQCASEMGAIYAVFV